MKDDWQILVAQLIGVLLGALVGILAGLTKAGVIQWFWIWPAGPC